MEGNFDDVIALLACQTDLPTITRRICDQTCQPVAICDLPDQNESLVLLKYRVRFAFLIGKHVLIGLLVHSLDRLN